MLSLLSYVFSSPLKVTHQLKLMVVEVFKTNVNKRRQANRLLNAIHNAFGNHKANFDLDDCDKILRVQCDNGTLCAKSLISFLNELGCRAEVLTD
jgi:hypothetical protein